MNEERSAQLPDALVDSFDESGAANRLPFGIAAFASRDGRAPTSWRLVESGWSESPFAISSRRAGSAGSGSGFGSKGERGLESYQVVKAIHKPRRTLT